MARAPDKRIEQAKAMYLKGMKLVEIASQLNLPEGTVRRWKSTHRWDNERSDENSERSERKRREKKKAAENEIEQVMKNPDLTDKQQLFCLYYVRYFNATKAYQKAYGCSYEAAKSNGYQLLANTYIRNEIQVLKQSRLNRELLDEHDIFQKYMDIAFADITDFVQFGQEEEYVIGSFGPVQVEDPVTGKKVPLKQKVNTVHFRESDNVDGTIIAEIKNGKNGASIKLADRMKALEWLARHMDMATEEQKTKVEQIKAQTAAIKAKAQANDNSFMEKEQSKLDDLIRQMRGGDG